MNKTILLGKVASPAETTITKGGKEMGTVVVSIKRDYPSADGTVYTDDVPITLFGKVLECVPQLLVGTNVAVQASISVFINEKNGKKYYNISIVANSLEVIA